jgi:hypothetical protein
MALPGEFKNTKTSTEKRKAKPAFSQRCEKETFLSEEKKIDLPERQPKTTFLEKQGIGFPVEPQKNELFL